MSAPRLALEEALFYFQEAGTETIERCDRDDVILDEYHVCPQCGVYHGDPCDVCGRRGYHRDDCADLEPAYVTLTADERESLILKGVR